MTTSLLLLGISGASGKLSSLGALLPGCAAARFSLGMIVTAAEFRPREAQPSDVLQAIVLLEQVQ